MAAYIRSLGDRYAAMGAGQRKAKEPAAFTTPNRAAERRRPAGRCSTDALRASATAPTDWACWRPPTKRRGYVFPPLWGPDSFNNGAGMHRVLTAARFIKARMPLGKPTLTDDEAFDVAAFINAQPRPADGQSRARLSRPRRPSRSTIAYGPFADAFPRGAAPARAVPADRGVLQGAEGQRVRHMIREHDLGLASRLPRESDASQSHWPGQTRGVSSVYGTHKHRHR